MGKARSRLLQWSLRRQLARNAVDVSRLELLPDATLMPLRRDGLDPVAELGRTRERAPVSKLHAPFGMNVWLVTGYEASKAVLGDAKAFSNDFNNLVGASSGSPGGLGFVDPPEHTRLRRLLTPEFTMRRLSRLGPRIDDIVAERLDAMAQVDGPVDLVRDFALPIPSLAICELLGVPYADRDDFQRLSSARFDLFGGATASLGAMSESLSYLLGVVRRQRKSPGDGLLGMIIKEHGEEVEDRELAGLVDGLLTGGFETTASMLALGALVLLRDPATFRAIHDDDDAVHGFVEEALRYLTVVQVSFARFARTDVEIAGVRIAQGDMVVCSLSAANRDDALGARMGDFDATRRPAPHLAFGHGIHRCIGAELGRMELRAAYPALLRRFPKMRLAVEPGELAFRKASIVYGVESLPVLLR